MSVKNKDAQGRWRNKTVAFRVSPAEWTQFETAVRLSGLSKQDYLSHRIQEREIVVQGNPRVYKALRDELRQVLERLQEMDAVDRDMLDTIQLLCQTMEGLKQGQKESPYPKG